MSRRGLWIGALVVLTASVAPASYHFVHYAGKGAPYVPIYERFPIENMPGGAVQYFIEAPPSSLKFSSGDGFPALVSQIRAAADVWNSVGSSTLRLQFGGMATPNVTMNTPAVTVTFDDELPPGILAMGGPVTRGDMATMIDGTNYVPIIRSTLAIGTDLRSPSESDSGAGPTWSDRLFLTLVHELGHTLGLQHTWTSSVMSTEITRAMTKAHPLGADDVAGISDLYPSRDWFGSTGSIAGRVTLGDAGVNLASVVAITTDGEAISTLTNPDGTYALRGLPPGGYQVYVHPVPPSLPYELLQPVNLVLPTDSDGALPLSPAFNTIFQTGNASPGDPVVVAAGKAVQDVNFQVTQRESVGLYSVQSYSYFWNEAAQAYDTSKPATFVLGDTTAPYAVLTGQGLVAGNGKDPASGLSMSVLGAPDMTANQALKAYPYSQGYLQLDLSTAGQTTPGPRHLVMSLNGETEIVPSALLLASAAPPVVSGLQANSDGTVTVSGSGLDSGTRILFDGVPAAVQSTAGRSATVVPPAAPQGAAAAVVALAADGLDSSFFAPVAAPAKFTYTSGATPQVQISPSSVQAGTEAVLDVTGTNVDFGISGLSIGFGTSDIVVRRVWLLSAQHALVQVTVSPAAALGSTTLTVAAGLQTVDLPLSLQVTAGSQAPAARAADVQPASVLPGLSDIYPLILPLDNVPLAAYSVSFGAQLDTGTTKVVVPVLAYLSGQLVLALPPGLSPGPAKIVVYYLGVPMAPVYVNVSAPVPQIFSASNPANGLQYSQSAPAQPGGQVALSVSNLSGDISPVDLGALSVSIAGVPQALSAVTSPGSASGVYALQFALGPTTRAAEGATTVPVIVTAGGRVSDAFNLPVAASAN